MRVIGFKARVTIGFFLSMLAISGIVPSSATAQTQYISERHEVLQSKLAALSRRALPGQIGIAVLDHRTGEQWGINQNTPFPMMSVFKAPVAAAVLARVDAGKYDLANRIELNPADFVEGSAVPSIGDALKASHTHFELRELLAAAVSQSDNTSVDALIRLLGAPSDVTNYLQSKHIAGMHMETGEQGYAEEAEHLSPGAKPPAHETENQTLAREKEGYLAVLADPRNQSTPVAAIDFLTKLADQQLLSPRSTELLIDMMRKQTLPSRLRAGLPSGFELADKCGTTSPVNGKTAVWNDIGIVTGPDGHQLMIAVFLKDSPLSRQARDELFADIARTVISQFYSAL